MPVTVRTRRRGMSVRSAWAGTLLGPVGLLGRRTQTGGEGRGERMPRTARMRRWLGRGRLAERVLGW